MYTIQQTGLLDSFDNKQLILLTPSGRTKLDFQLMTWIDQGSTGRLSKVHAEEHVSYPVVSILNDLQRCGTSNQEEL